MSKNHQDLEILERELHSRKKQKKNRKRVLGVILLTMVLVLLGFTGIVFGVIRSKWNLLETLPSEESFRKEDVYINPDLTKTAEQETEPTETGTSTAAESAEKPYRDPSEDYITIMLYGVDARNSHDLESDANADTDIICVINKETKEVKLVSVLRDTFLETTTGKHTKLTDIYAGYGYQESMSTLNKCFDLKLTEYVSVNWKMVAKTINMMGGVDLHLTGSEVNYINNGIDGVSDTTGISSDYLENRGTTDYHLDGVQTVVHSRNRTTGGGHDIARAGRQREVIDAMLAAAKNCSVSELMDLVDVILPGISTNLTMDEILSLALDVRKYSITDTCTFPFEYRDQSNLRTAYVYCDTLVDNAIALHEYLYGDTEYTPTSTVYDVSDYITAYRHEHP